MVTEFYPNGSVAEIIGSGASGGGGHFTAHGGRGVDSVFPIEALVNERHVRHTTAAEDKGADGHAGGVFPGRINGGALSGGCGESAVRVGGFAFAVGSPPVAMPIGEMRRWRIT